MNKFYRLGRNVLRSDRVNELYQYTSMKPIHSLNSISFFSYHDLDMKKLHAERETIIQMLYGLPVTFWCDYGEFFHMGVFNSAYRKWGTNDDVKKLFAMGNGINMVSINNIQPTIMYMDPNYQNNKENPIIKIGKIRCHNKSYE